MNLLFTPFTQMVLGLASKPNAVRLFSIDSPVRLVAGVVGKEEEIFLRLEAH